MEKPETRRICDPFVVRQVHVAIMSIRKHRQIANLRRLVKFLGREHGYEPKQILYYIHYSVMDGLVIETITVGCKGSKAGVQQEGYWIPERNEVLDGQTHDWYCFVCHKPGEVVVCSTCFRVYHQKCLDGSYQKAKYWKNWECPHCTKCIEDDDQEELGRCLKFVVHQQTDRFSELRKRPSEELCTYYDFFVFTHYDLTMLLKDCQGHKFTSVEGFRGKVRLMLHNYNVVFGPTHKLTKLMQKFFDHCMYEVDEMQLCRNCYFLSNTKPMQDWFCKPCQPPHQVVWAKQKGFEYWPAKIIRVEDNRIDVRFFGKHHPRAWLGIDSVRAITVSPAKLKIKQKPVWKQASLEMKEYLRHCECAFGVDEALQVINYDSPYGIGKNKKLLARITDVICDLKNNTPSAAISVLTENKFQKDTAISTESKTNISSSNLDALTIPSDDQPCCSTQSPRITCLDDSVRETVSPQPMEIETSQSEIADAKISPNKLKRKSLETCAMVETDIIDSAESQTSVVEVKRPRRRYYITRDTQTQTSNNRGSDAGEQINPSGPDGKECSCRKKYEGIMIYFRDYVIERQQLQKGKLIHAVTYKAAEAMMKAEDDIRKEVTEKYEKILKDLKEAHQKELEDLESKLNVKTEFISNSDDCSETIDVIATSPLHEPTSAETKMDLTTTTVACTTTTTNPILSTPKTATCSTPKNDAFQSRSLPHRTRSTRKVCARERLDL